MEDLPLSISSILIRSVWVVLSIATYLLRTYNNTHFEMPCLATMLAWKKYELYNYVMRLAYILIWSPYIYLVSLNTNKRVQHLHSIQQPLCHITSSPKDMNAIMCYLKMWKKTLITPHLMLSKLRIIIHELNDHLEMRCSTPHVTAVLFAPLWFYDWESAALHSTLKHISSTLIVINFWVSLATHHHPATQAHSPNNFHQSELSCNMHHFIAICWGKIKS